MHTLRAKTLRGFIFLFDRVKIIILFLKVLIIPWGVVRTSCCPGTGTTGNKLFPAGTFEFLETGKKTQTNSSRSLKWSFNLKLPPDRTTHTSRSEEVWLVEKFLIYSATRHSRSTRTRNPGNRERPGSQDFPVTLSRVPG